MDLPEGLLWDVEERNFCLPPSKPPCHTFQCCCICGCRPRSEPKRKVTQFPWEGQAA